MLCSPFIANVLRATAWQHSLFCSIVALSLENLSASKSHDHVSWIHVICLLVTQLELCGENNPFCGRCHHCEIWVFLIRRETKTSGIFLEEWPLTLSQFISAYGMMTMISSANIFLEKVNTTDLKTCIMYHVLYPAKAACKEGLAALCTFFMLLLILF